MSTDWVSPGVVRSTMPPLYLRRAVSNRATGSGSASRSITLIAEAFSALCTARLRVRAARDTSRDVVTVDPFLSVVAYAEASRTASSGVTSTLISPDTPRSPNSVRWPRDSQITQLLTTAPASMVLNG